MLGVMTANALFMNLLLGRPDGIWGGGYEANYLHFLVFRKFQHCQKIR